MSAGLKRPKSCRHDGRKYEVRTWAEIVSDVWIYAAPLLRRLWQAESVVAVRQADISDGESLFQLVRLFPTPTPASKEAFVRCLKSKLSDASSYVALAWDGDSAVGYVSGDFHPAFYAGGRVAWVDEILVVAERQRRGIGTLLIEAFEQWANVHRCVLVSLATAGSAGFYERLGYATKAGYFKKYFASGRPRSDTV